MEELERIEKYLNDNGIYPEYVDYDADDNTVFVQINHGDWKHEHLRCDYLMGLFGYINGSAEVTYEDGSDCYSALRTYTR